MNAIILSIGDELILGQTIDTNSAWLSQQLATIGVKVVAHLTIGDDQIPIEQAIRDSLPRCEFLFITGGLGPTKDDLTRQAIARVLNVDLQLDDKWLHRMEAFFRRLNRPMPETNKIQAMIPERKYAIKNDYGTACGIEGRLQR